MCQAKVLLLGFPCDAPFKVLFALEQMRRPDIYREVSRRVALLDRYSAIKNVRYEHHKKNIQQPLLG